MPIEVLWDFWICKLMFFLKTGIFGPLFLYKNNILSVPFSFVLMGLPLCAWRYFWWSFTVSEVLFIFHQYSFFRLNISWLISNSLILHFIYSNLLLISSRELFISLILIFNSVSIWLSFFSICISLIFFYLVKCLFSYDL